MAEIKPLRLKAQRVTGKVQIAQSSPVVQVCVDTGVFHLQNNFDYLVPESISSKTLPGVLVKVPFGNSEVLGYVVSRTAGEFEPTKLKPITKLVSSVPLLSEELISIITDTCERYACKPWDLVASAIPPRVALTEKNFVDREPEQIVNKTLRLAHELRIVSNVFALRDQIEDLLRNLDGSEQLLVVVPDERDLNQITNFKYSQNPLVLSSTLEKSERYGNYLRARFDFPKLIFGNRSAIFTPLQPNSKILIFNDGDESMYERRFPGWNVRDVALLRSGDFSLVFAGSSPSLEIARLCELGWIKNRNLRAGSNKDRIEFTFADSRESEISIIKRGLKAGNVLVSMAETGYVNAIACQKCRNQAKCVCGGKLYIPNKASVPICHLCEMKFANWKCSWCSGETIRAISRGSARYLEEISKALPGARVMLSKGGSRIDVLPDVSENILVISTYGCEPAGEYSAVVLRSLENLTNRIDLRSLESIRRIILENLGKISTKNGGLAFIDLQSSNPISQGLLRGDALALCDVEILERRSSKLPPFTRLATITGESAAIRLLATQVEQNELFSSVSVISKLPASNEQSKLVLRADIEKSEKFSLFLRDLARYRSLKGLIPLSIRIDPYSI